ncbi:MAG: lipoyl(octanoyl) transferase LipB [Pseudomonadota bacterium]
MQSFTAARTPATPDELWLLEHPSVYTLGLNAKPEHLHDPGDIPVIHVDRGGQVTHHGPGQLVAYTLLDLQRRGWGVRRLVSALEQAVIDLLAEFDIPAEARRDAPGVYVRGAKIAAVGLRVRHGCCYHGLSFNVAMDLEPFRRMNPCGYAGLAVTQFSDLGGPADMRQAGALLGARLVRQLGYNTVQHVQDT